MHIYLFNVGSPGTFLVVQWLSLCLLCRGTGSIPGWGTNSLHAAQRGQKENSKKGRKGGRERRRSKRVNGYQGLSHSVKEIEHHLYCEDLWGPLNDCFPLLTQKNNC